MTACVSNHNGSLSFAGDHSYWFSELNGERMGYFKEVVPKMIQYRLVKLGWVGASLPMNLTFSVTNVCQSRCKTCSIWKLYNEHPEKRKEELSLGEIESVFKSMGHIYIFNVSGGEPFLRDDFSEIIKLACKYLTPGIIHIPTNAIAEKKTRHQLKDILSFLQINYPDVQLTVKPSLDHIEGKHDDIRGVPGNFTKVISLFRWLQEMKSDYPMLHAELGTVISNWNVEDIDEISTFVAGLGADSYRNEIAEQRSEMFNNDDLITPSPELYEEAIHSFVSNIRSEMKNKTMFQKITNAFRIVYYNLAIRIMGEKRQVIPCYAGISNAHMTPYGDIWACCTLGYSKSMGNVRNYDYNFLKLWKSPEAMRVRSEIEQGECHCPLANQTYSNILMDTPSLLRVIFEIFRPR